MFLEHFAPGIGGCIFIDPLSFLVFPAVDHPLSGGSSLVSIVNREQNLRIGVAIPWLLFTVDGLDLLMAIFR